MIYLMFNVRISFCISVDRLRGVWLQYHIRFPYDGSADHLPETSGISIQQVSACLEST